MGIDPKYRSEFTPEEFEDFDRRIAQLSQSWHDRLQFSDLSLVKNYLAGNIQFHLHGLINPAQGVSKKFCAILGGPREPLEFARLWQSEGDIRLSWINADATRRHDSHEGNEQETVLFGVVELVKNEKRGLPSLTFLVRLDTLDQYQRATGDALYYSVLQRLFVFGRRFTNGKADATGVGVLSQYKYPHQMIQGASEVVEDFARNNCKSKRNDVVGGLVKDFYNAQPSVMVDIRADAISVRPRVGKPLEFRLEIDDVLIGPFDLRPTAIHKI